MKRKEHKTDWSKLYGELENGDYRLIKEANNRNFYKEFMIDE